MTINLIRASNDSGVGRPQLTHPIQSAKTLAQRVEAGDLRNKSIEVDVCSSFDALCCNYDERVIAFCAETSRLHTRKEPR